MIILDTNVVSEPLRQNGSIDVQNWLDRQIAETLYLTTTSLAELLVGVEILPAGRRRARLGAALQDLLETLFRSRILPFDREAASIYPALVSRARAAGYSISFADGQIAAIAAQRGFAVATRDQAPFLAVGIPVIDPWRKA